MRTPMPEICTALLWNELEMVGVHVMVQVLQPAKATLNDAHEIRTVPLELASESDIDSLL